MKKILKKEFIVGLIVGIILASSIAVYAVVSASQVTYKDGKTVEYALNDLYDKADDKIVLNTFGTTLYNQSMGNIIANRNTNINLTKGKYIVNALYGVAWSRYNSYPVTVSDPSYVSFTASDGTIETRRISGKVYKVSGNEQFETDKAYDIDYLESSIYYINVTSNEATINLTYTAGTYTDNVQAQIVALQAIPIN